MVDGRTSSLYVENWKETCTLKIEKPFVFCHQHLQRAWSCILLLSPQTVTSLTSSHPRRQTSAPTFLHRWCPQHSKVRKTTRATCESNIRHFPKLQLEKKYHNFDFKLKKIMRTSQFTRKNPKTELIIDVQSNKWDINILKKEILNSAFFPFSLKMSFKIKEKVLTKMSLSLKSNKGQKKENRWKQSGTGSIFRTFCEAVSPDIQLHWWDDRIPEWRFTDVTNQRWRFTFNQHRNVFL